ncbi:MAG: 16S rRNA (guanine(966)-N(2))-methyltransferase RsmD [Oscillospiraceae bacterium]|jgi:16S rRNA (guanine(966)-N(2))-methyltransferase RsmD|nr:16S rRNA (guanine(966)-N(2))-methyltransferase RsmD [Oscillospiraceae bacterium]
MNVITGTARGRKLLSPSNDVTRPTAGVVKEAIFNIIQFEVEGAKVLDLFAGSGQLGIEALSRGAAGCTFVESNKEVCEVIERNLRSTGFFGFSRVENVLAEVFLKRAGVLFDIAILDPPYAEGIINKVMPSVVRLMAENGVIICEAAKADTLDERFGKYKLIREYRYGKRKLGLFRSV